jgi:hypothetical protein
LIVSALAPWILAISDEQHLSFRIEIGPFDATDLILAHRRCNSETDDPADRNLLSRVGVECRYKPVEFILRRSSVAFVALADQA